MAHYRIIGNALDYPWVIYVCSDVINEHERVSRDQASMAEQIRRWTTEPAISLR
jgi:hypothetical protein